MGMNVFDRKLPRLHVAFAAGLVFNPKGARFHSLGRSPRNHVATPSQAPKGRDRSACYAPPLGANLLG